MASRSLGTLTLDLVAKVGGFEAGMDKASRKAKKTSQDISKTAKVMGIAFAAGTATAVAGLTVLVSRQLEVIDTQAKMAQRLRTTYDSLTTLGRAGELAGVSIQQIEVASRSLDINLGKASQGIGAQAKAFEKLRLNADEIAKLPLDKRISAINTALSENVSVTERAAIAADLFGARGAAAIQQLDPATIAEAARQAEIFGLKLSDIDAAKVEQANDALSTFGLLGDGIAQQITIALAPALRQVGIEFLDAAESAGGLGTAVEDSVRKSVNALAFVVDAVDGAKRAVDTAISSIALFGSTVLEFFAVNFGGLVGQLNIVPGVDFTDAENKLKQFAEFADAFSLEAKARIEKNLNTPLSGQALVDFFDRAKASGQAAAEAAVAAREKAGELNDTLGETTEELKQIEVQSKKWTVSKDVQETLRAWEDYRSLVRELRTDEEKLTDQLNERLAVMDKISGNLTDQERTATASKIADAALPPPPQFAGLAPEVGGAFGELGKIDEAQAELEKWYATRLDMLAKFREQHAELSAVWDEQEISLKKEHEDQIANIEQARQQASLVAAEDTFGDLAALVGEFAGKQSAAYKILFAAEKGAAIARSIIAIQTAIAQAATAGPFPANLAAMASVAAATASIISTISSTAIGAAHDGIDEVPKSGTWLLEKGERVTTEKTSKKLDRTLSQVQDNMQSVASQNIRIVNAYDDSHLQNYLGSSEGEKVIMNTIRRNGKTIRSLAV